MTSALLRRSRLVEGETRQSGTTTRVARPLAAAQPQIQLPQFSRRIYRSSQLACFSIGGTWYNGLLDNFFLTTAVLFSSLLYWRDPVDGWRRKLDMICANGTVLYQVVYSARFLPTQAATLAHFASVVLAASCYLGARHFGRTKGDFDNASKCHVAMHILGNISNVLLYDALGKNHLSW
jgi:hypothetical protein